MASHHTKAQTFKLTELVREQYAASGKNDAEFARMASELLGFPCSSHHVSESRDIFDLPNNVAKQRAVKEQDAVGVPELRLSLDAVEEKVDALGVNHTQLVEHNRLLLRAIEDLKTEMVSQVESLQSAIASMSSSLHTQLALGSAAAHRGAPAAAEAHAAPAVGARKRVAVSGLSAAQRAQINSEFGEVLDLRYVDGDDAKQSEMRTQAKTCDAIVTLSGHVPADVKSSLKARGAQLIQLHGNGMTALRDKLTGIYAAA